MQNHRRFTNKGCISYDLCNFPQLSVSRCSVTNVVLVLLSVLHFVMSLFERYMCDFFGFVLRMETVLRLGVNCYT